MDLKLYYQKIRDIEAKILEEFPIIVSRETADGGKDGIKTEVPRRLAAKLIVEGLARLASTEEARLFREMLLEAKRVAEQVAAAARVQLAVLSSAELDRLRGAPQPKE
jgi:hypothetical protein